MRTNKSCVNHYLISHWLDIMEHDSRPLATPDISIYAGPVVWENQAQFPNRDLYHASYGGLNSIL